jgi:hypothetical protein
MRLPIPAPHPSRGAAAVAMLVATALVGLRPQPAAALTVQVNGTNYDLELYTGSYTGNPAAFQLPANGGRMPWWGQPSLAADFAFALAAGLSPTPLPADGPLFATAYTGTDVEAAYYDLTTLGSTDVINENVAFDPNSSQSYAVVNSPASVPAPLPLVGAAAAFSCSRRLRRRHGLAEAQGQRLTLQGDQRDLI